MSTSQIRLAKGTQLGDIAQDLIVGIEEILSDHKGISPVKAGQIAALVRLVRRRLREAVDAYRVCGEKARCHLRSTPAGVGGPWQQSCPTTNERIFLLNDGVDLLATRIAADVFDNFCPGATTRDWLALKPDLDRVIEESLGPVLYENPFCENCPHCTTEQRTDPWVIKTTRPGEARNKQTS